jgi:hypothetical protein
MEWTSLRTEIDLDVASKHSSIDLSFNLKIDHDNMIHARSTNSTKETYAAS